MKRQTINDWTTDNGLTLIRGWATDGLSKEQIAKNIGICRATLYKWASKSDAIQEAMDSGKEIADYQVVNAMHQSATGYYAEDSRIEVVKGQGGIVLETRKYINKRWVQPSTGAQVFWLKNRMPDKWKDKRGNEVTINADIEDLTPLADLLKEEGNEDGDNND